MTQNITVGYIGILPTVIYLISYILYGNRKYLLVIEMDYKPIMLMVVAVIIGVYIYTNFVEE